MKKILSIIIVCMASFMFFSCSGGNSPQSVAKKAMKCIKKGDVKGYVDCIYSKESEEEYRDLLVKQFESNKKPSNEVENFKYLDEDVNEESGKAKVFFDVTYKNGRTGKETINLMRDDKGKWWVKIY